MNKEDWKFGEPSSTQLQHMKVNIQKKHRRSQKMMISAVCCFMCMGLFSIFNRKENDKDLEASNFILAKEELQFNYSYEDGIKEAVETPAKYSSQKINMDVSRFEEECIQYTELSLKGTVSKTRIEDDYLIATMDIEDLFYQKEKYQNKQIDIYIMLYQDTSLEDLVGRMHTGGTYYINLLKKDGHFEPIYVYHPLIEETKNGYILFPEEWKSLINQETYRVEKDENSLFQLYARKDKDFKKDYVDLIRRYVK